MATDSALPEVERLWGAKLGTPEGDRLDVLAMLIDSYEQTHHAMDPPDPIEAIKFRTSRKKLTRKQLEPVIRRLHATLGISAEVLI